jgi:hypothetical protein
MNSTESLRNVIAYLKIHMALVALEESKVCWRYVATFDDTRKVIGIFRIKGQYKVLKDDLSTTVEQAEEEERSRNAILSDSSVLQYM